MAHALDYRWSFTRRGEIVIHASGEIQPGDDAKLRRYTSALSAGVRIIALTLDSAGGNVHEAVQLARSVRASGLSTGTVPGGTCASACFLIFAAGITRDAWGSSRIGVHSASIHGADGIDAQALTILLAREAASYGVPPNIIGRMVITAHDEIAWLSATEVRQMGVGIVDDRAAPNVRRRHFSSRVLSRVAPAQARSPRRT